jgi:hypothetical protein
VGGMGNTVTSHVMYSCGKWDLNLDTFFSRTGDAHAARTLYKDLRSVLKPMHITEDINKAALIPPFDFKCIIEIKTSPLYKMLELKMAYSKFLMDVPLFDNISNFFQLDKQPDNQQKLWKDFYQSYKDPSWPECDSIENIKFLPDNIQQEIYKNYQPPTVGVNNKNWVSLLAIAYYDLLQSSKNHPSLYGGEVLLLDDYFSNRISVLKNQINKHLGWIWDDQKSDEFYQYVIQNNQRYIDWLSNLQELLNHTVNKNVVPVNLESWEQSLLIAQVCCHLTIDPRSLQWDNIKNFDSNEDLINILRKDYG